MSVVCKQLDDYREIMTDFRPDIVVRVDGTIKRIMFGTKDDLLRTGYPGNDKERN